MSSPSLNGCVCNCWSHSSGVFYFERASRKPWLLFCSPNRIVVHGERFASAVVPASAKPFNFQLEYQLTEEQVSTPAHQLDRMISPQRSRFLETGCISGDYRQLCPSADVNGGESGCQFHGDLGPAFLTVDRLEHGRNNLQNQHAAHRTSFLHGRGL